MFHKVCEKIVLSGIENGTIANEQKDEHLYGMNMLFNVTINIISMVIIGIVTGRPLECIMFCFIYKTIRKYTGGFHFESAWICYISSCVMYLLVMAAIIYIPFKVYEISAIVVISSIIMWMLSPIEAINKPLDECEKRIFKKRARFRLAAVFVAYAFCIFINEQFAYSIAFSVIFATLFAIAGKIKLMCFKEKRLYNG
jgi:accessory gene regulator B